MRRLILLFGLLALLAACGWPSTDTPERVNQQLIEALIAQDSATVLRLFDPELHTREAERERLTHDWATRQQPVDPMSRCSPSLGPLKGQELAPAEIVGATARVRTTLHHEAGDAWLEVELSQTREGWRVFAWSSGNDCRR